jgi:predicted XRE-type DNA-binding protein
MMVDALENSELHNEFIRRLKQGRDIRVIVSAENAATGVGKTTAAFVLCLLWDVYGWTAAKGTLDPREYAQRYYQVPPGSCLLLDEAEKGLERRRSMSKDVLEVGHAFATLRYRQVAGVLTLPSRSMMDKRIAEMLTDYWIVCKEQPRGEAEVYKFGYNEVIDAAYKEHVETFKWPPMDSHPEFQKLTAKKEDREQGQIQSQYVHRDELEDLKENYWNKATQKKTFELVRVFYDLYGGRSGKLSQSDIGDAVGVDQSQISRMVNAESFEDFYSSPNEDALASS